MKSGNLENLILPNFKEFWDLTLDKQTLIVGTHGLDKKTNKTPRQEIEKAKRSMNKYFEQKKDKI
ncbi:MAG: type II toxin-antitoxin system RelE/ParE family toxin [Chitinophagaceae bacterium]|nr:type II toxin-antitoxin system RelE/ParE family toxin [Chitinophagaceae bacterium]